MEIDYKKIELYLDVLLKSKEPMINTLDYLSELKLNVDDKDEFKEFFHYTKLLKDAELIICDNDNEGNLGLSFTSMGEPMISVKMFRLTINGHQILEALKTDGIWDKIGSVAKSLGISGLKQIPALAIKYFENNQ